MSDTYCPLPWIHLASHPNGLVSLCCHSDHTNLTGFSNSDYPHFVKHWNLNRDEITVIHNSDSFKQARVQLLTNRKPEACSKCFATEAKGGTSKRQQEIINWPTYDKKWAKENTSEHGTIKPDLAYIELRLGNACNLKCITCNPISSDKWQNDYDVLAESLPFVDQGMTTKNRSTDTDDWTKSDRFWDDLLESSYWLRKLYINGGEPTHNTGHIWYLEQLVNRNLAHNITLWYSTNMTYLPKKLLGIWSKFKKVEISASIDDLAERNDYIRYPSKWSKIQSVLSNISMLPNIDLAIVQTISALNFLQLPEFAKWIKVNNFKWSVNHVTSPSYLNANILPQDARMQIFSQLETIAPSYITHELMLHYNGPANGEINNFVQYITKLDEIRNTHIDTILPEVMKYVK